MNKISFCTVTLVLSAFLSPFITSVSAQNNTDFTSELIDFENQSRDSTLSYTKWRVTFLNSLGTNGNNSQEYTAQYSINLVGGIHGGLDGREFGLLYNVETNYVHGFQIAGLGNVSLGEMSGLNIAGLSNYSQGPMKGLQLSGLANISEISMEGLQLSAGLNVSAGEQSGMHIAGIANISNDDIEGLTIAGIANVSAEDQSGLIMSSVANVSGDFMEGLILTGGINAAKKIEGLSVSGVATLSNDLTGLTISPVNIQKTITGLHVGFVNVAEEIDGVSIGLVSWYGNGRKNVDIRYSDSGFLDMGFTTGTHRLYNQISVGFVPQESNVFKLGGSIGLVFDMRDRFSGISKDNWTVTHELSLYQYMEEKWHRQNTKQFTYRYLISSMPNNQFSIYAGPSLNILKEGSVDDLAWYSVWSPSIKSANYQVWVGFNIGMRLFKQEAVERVNFPLERNF